MGAIRIGAVIAQKYQLEAPLARGGMGSVWSARHVSLDRRLAVKFISPEVAARGDVRTRFDREARAAASLQSPNVVQIHDYGIDDDVPYLVMELLDGEDLGVRLAQRGRLGVGETVHLVRQVARALRRFADAGIVHRDLKPSNLFIVRGEDEEGEIVKVLDFGIAKVPRLAAGDSTRTGVMIGSPRYMSPEQAQGSPLVDHRSDLWALGVITYRALAGQMPFQGADVAALMLNVCNETPPPPSRFDAALGPAIDAFFLKALARSPDDRFQTARELVFALEDAAGEPAVSAHSDSFTPPLPSHRTLAPRPPGRAPVPTRSLTPSPVPPAPREIAATHPSVSLAPVPVPVPTVVVPPTPRGELSTLPEPSSRRGVVVIEDTARTILPGSVDVPGHAEAWRPRPVVVVAMALVAVASLLWALAPPVAGWVVAPSSTPEPTDAGAGSASTATALVVPAAPGPLPDPRAPAPLPSSRTAPGSSRKRPWTRAHPILGF